MALLSHFSRTPESRSAVGPVLHLERWGQLIMPMPHETCSHREGCPVL